MDIMKHFVMNHYNPDEIIYLKQKVLEKDYLFFSVFFKGIESYHSEKEVWAFIDSEELQQYAIDEDDINFITLMDAFICHEHTIPHVDEDENDVSADIEDLIVEITDCET